MPQSSEYTAIRFFRENAGKVGLPSNNILWIERFSHINRAIEDSVQLFADVLAPEYMESSVILDDTTGRYSTTTGTFTALTNTITITMNTSFSVSDVGKLMAIRVGSAVYFPIITSYVSATSVVVNGNALPSVDSTIQVALLGATHPAGGTIDLSQLRVMWAGQQVKLDLRSTATRNVDFLTPERLRKFRSASDENKNKIVWSLTGRTMWLDKGANVGTYNVLTLDYPALPEVVITDGQALPINDGPLIGIAGIRLQSILANALVNMGIPAIRQDLRSELMLLVESLYRSMTGTASLETVKQKASALL